MKNRELLEKNLSENNGIFRLAPNWVPRAFCVPGGRLKLAPKDLYALGKERGGIDERWFASTTQADNEKAPEDEGLSYIYIEGKKAVKKILFKEAIELMGDRILGKEVMSEYGGWKMFSKFFDNQNQLPHHVHLQDEHAQQVNSAGKPEGYYFPPQLNFTGGDFPYTFFGLNPGTTKADVKKCLADFDKGDNGILNLSRAYKLKPGTGWLVPAGLLHAPGSLLTYEPQAASDVFSMFQSVVQGQTIPRELLVKDVPKDKKDDLDYLVDILDWKANVNPNLVEDHLMQGIPVKSEPEKEEKGYHERWIVYGADEFSAKELTVFPGQEAVIEDKAAYGAILVEGHGKINGLQVETPNLIRFGDLTRDEVFVTHSAAENGVKIKNKSKTENLVLLKHFGPGHPTAPKEVNPG